MGNLWLSFFHPISTRFRRKRFAQILERDLDILSKRILDVGGSVHFWQKAGVDIARHEITLLNIAEDAQATDIYGELGTASIVLYDGYTIPWPDQSFDWVISNSVIEHVAPERRDRFCAEIRRTGANYIVQTPAYLFPVEPHFVMPLLHWLPRSLGRRVAGFGLWGLLRKRNRADVDAYFDEVQLLTLKEFRSFFPEADLTIERFAGIPKSYTLTSHGKP